MLRSPIANLEMQSAIAMIWMSGCVSSGDDTNREDCTSLMDDDSEDNDASDEQSESDDELEVLDSKVLEAAAAQPQNLASQLHVIMAQLEQMRLENRNSRERQDRAEQF